MAKKATKKEIYILNPSAKGDLYLDKKYSLDSELSQKDLAYLYSQGYTDIIVKKEG